MDYIFIMFSIIEACVIVSYIVWKNLKDKKPVGTIFLFSLEDGKLYYKIGFKLNNKDYSYDDLVKLKNGTVEITKTSEQVFGFIAPQTKEGEENEKRL